MLTIFSTPKPFRGHIDVIQRNAIQSWLLLRPACEVILLSNGEGTAEVASRFGIRYVPDVECNDCGTPLINSIFSIAQDIASHPLTCYVNADIILMSDFLATIRQIQMPSFLVIGRRWDIDVKEPLDFASPDWERQLRARLTKAGRLHAPSGLDYFVFPRGMYRDILPLAIGRGAWDNWLVYRARSLGATVADATKAITAVHQNHDYSHHPDRAEGIWHGPERRRNIELMGVRERAFTADYATQILTPNGMKPALSLRHLYFRMRAIPVLYPKLQFLLNLFRIMQRIVIGIQSIWRRNLGNE